MSDTPESTPPAWFQDLEFRSWVKRELGGLLPTPPATTTIEEATAMLMASTYAAWLAGRASVLEPTKSPPLSPDKKALDRAHAALRLCAVQRKVEQSWDGEHSIAVCGLCKNRGGRHKPDCLMVELGSAPEIPPPPPKPEPPGPQLRAARRAMGLTLTPMAAMLDITSVDLSSMEQGLLRDRAHVILDRLRNL